MTDASATLRPLTPCTRNSLSTTDMSVSPIATFRPGGSTTGTLPISRRWRSLTPVRRCLRELTKDVVVIDGRTRCGFCFAPFTPARSVRTPRVSRRIAGVPHAFHAIVAKALANSPDHRYETCVEFVWLISRTLC